MISNCLCDALSATPSLTNSPSPLLGLSYPYLILISFAEILLSVPDMQSWETFTSDLTSLMIDQQELLSDNPQISHAVLEYALNPPPYIWGLLSI